MARAPKRPKPKTRFYRCAKCRAPVPTSYRTCGTCGHDGATPDLLFTRALAMFPGSVEILTKRDTHDV